jgi:hypothetical protein
MGVMCWEIAGATVSGSNGVDGVIEVKTSQNDASTTHATTLDARAALSAYVHAYMADAGGTATPSLSNATSQAGYNTPSAQFRGQWDINEGADVTSATFTTASADGLSLGIEIAVAAAGSNPRTLTLMGVGGER